MADEPTNQQPISDDQELAKVLAGVSQEADNVATDVSTTTPVEDTAPALPTPQENPGSSAESSVAPYTNSTEQSDTPTTPATPDQPTVQPTSSHAGPAGELDGVKKEALNELRPLVDKLDVSAEEKFDTYLLLLRSTDDKELIAPAHEAAKNIADEGRRAQALLDIIKEIDFLSQNQQS